MAALAVGLALPGGLAAQSGTVQGSVVDATTLQPLIGAQVQIGGTNLGTLTNAQGRYQVLNVPAGNRSVRVSLIGYGFGSQPVMVVAEETATADFRLEQSAVEIEGLIVTATGQEQRLREIGNSVSTINTDDLELAPIQNLSEMLLARAPGVIVQPTSGSTGTGSRIRIRGASSVSLSGTPLLIVDGIRVNNEVEDTGLFTGGIETTRWDDLNPEDIESIEILKGPAASALYGTAAANGVIQITTKTGRGGRTQIRAYAEGSSMALPSGTIPDNFRAFGFRSDLGRVAECSLVELTQSTCTGVDTVYSYNPLVDAPGTPLRDGSQTRLGVNVSGGSSDGAVTFYFSGENQDATGVTRDNSLTRQSFRANASGAVNERIRISASTNFINSYTQLPQEGNTGSGAYLNALYGADPQPANIERGGGFRFPYTAENVGGWKNEEELRRFVGSTTVDWRPTSWIQVNGVVGIDQVNRYEQSTIARGGLATGFFEEGLREQYRTQARDFTSNLNTNFTYGVTEAIGANTSLGVQYNAEEDDFTYVAGSGLAPGTLTAGTPIGVDEDLGRTKLFGVLGSQQISLNDRLFLTLAVRGDQDSAFGENIGFVTYPALSGSWVVADEPWFRDNPVFSTFRLRAAYGESGQRPERLDAVRTYETKAVAIDGAVTSGFTVENAGNPDLRPEITREYELGADFGFLDDRIAVQVTRFDRVTDDALVARPLPPSVGGPETQFFNLGQVDSDGWEASLQLEPLRTERVAVDFGVNFAANDNRLIELGDSLIPPITFGLQRHTENYPLGGFWAEAYDYSDINGDGMIQFAEVTSRANQDDASTNSSYLGQPLPTRELSFNANVRFLDMFRLSGLLEHKGGHQQYNWGGRLRCADANGSYCETRQVPGTASLEEQARIIARRKLGTSAGYIEDADFWKLREVALTISAPQDWLRQAGVGQDLSITLSGRNLATWTDYTGLDPEGNIPGSLTTDDDPGRYYQADLFTVPPTRQLILRVDVGL